MMLYFKNKPYCRSSGGVLLAALLTTSAASAQFDELEPSAESTDSSESADTSSDSDAEEMTPSETGDSAPVEEDENATSSERSVDSSEEGSLSSSDEVSVSRDPNLLESDPAPAPPSLANGPVEYDGDVPAPEFQRKTLWQGLIGDNNRFGIDGGMEMDFGYADYRFDTATYGKETFNDFRGQFWLAPVFEHRFGKNGQGFLRLSAEMVAWLREEVGSYQVNIFDAYAQAGIEDIVDLKVGRVTTWRIVQPGNGFDIYTLEDTGALKAPPYNGLQFYPFRYEVDYIWLRDTPGRAALHLYPLKKFLPTDWNDLGIELTGEFGKASLSNVFGARAAVIYDTKWLRLAGGAEYRTQKSAEQRVAADGTICEQCTWQYRRGMGASVVLRPPYIVGGLNATDGHLVNKGANGNNAEEGITDVQMQSAFIELHTGHLLAKTKDGKRPGPLADQRSEDIRKLTVGYGQRRSEQLIGNKDFERHTQQALYLKYNLGFNRAYLKLVGTYATGFQLDNTRAITEEPEFIYREGDMLAARLRFAYFW